MSSAIQDKCNAQYNTIVRVGVTIRFPNIIFGPCSRYCGVLLLLYDDQ